MRLDRKPIDFRFGAKDDASDKCIAELRKLQKQLSEFHSGSFEFFDFGFQLGLVTEKTREDKLRVLTRACIWHAIGLKAEFKLKLLYTIEGYLAAIDRKNPISTFLLARYILELAATVSTIDFELRNSLALELKDWATRGITFLGILGRGRHSTSDPKFKSIMKELGYPKRFLEPIHIRDAVRLLATRPGFSAAVGAYQRLSNICHHNGSSHKFLVERARETRSVVTRRGRAITLKDRVSAMTVSYPAPSFTSTSLALTARVAWWSSKSANDLLNGLPESPFPDNDLELLTNGRLTNAQIFYGPEGNRSREVGPKIGRNDPCPCGSGKKYKFCHAKLI